MTWMKVRMFLFVHNNNNFGRLQCWSKIVCMCVYVCVCVCVQAKNMAAQRLRYIERYHDYTGGWLMVFPSQTTCVAQPTNKES